MGYNPSAFRGDPNLPVESVTWVEADAYCTAIGGSLPQRRPNGSTRPEPGPPGRRYGNLDEIAWYWGTAASPSTVAKKKPNAFGLYDMLGNVVEWTHTLVLGPAQPGKHQPHRPFHRGIQGVARRRLVGRSGPGSRFLSKPRPGRNL